MPAWSATTTATRTSASARITTAESLPGSPSGMAEQHLGEDVEALVERLLVDGARSVDRQLALFAGDQQALLAALVGDALRVAALGQIDADAHALHAGQVAVGERHVVEPPDRLRLARRDVREDPRALALPDLDDGERDLARARDPAKRRVEVDVALHRIRDLRGRERRGERRRSVGQALREAHEVGTQIVVLVREQPAGAAEPARDLVRDEQRAVLLAQRRGALHEPHRGQLDAEV